MKIHTIPKASAMTTNEIRDAFITYFQQQDHTIVPSSPLVPLNDPTLLFTNAGMVQFKEVLLGLEQRPYQRAASIQRCLRAGGKHNDLENVGFTARHHTFFEMLGFFSFGDYFKAKAIHYAWDFLTQHLHLPPEKLWVTVYHADDEAERIWLQEVGVSAERFSRCGEADNFWSMGDTGPCGPCTEIFYDHGPSIPGGPPGSADADGDRYIEIWNLVFMQYNRDANGTLHPLPQPGVDTGMGLERIAAVVQGVHTNYETNEFVTLIQAIQGLTSERSPSINVIADHLRAVAFLILDGVRPSNEGRGYVLRRIIRRACRHAYKLNIATPFFATLLPALNQAMEKAYPALQTHQAQIAEVLTHEEIQFSKTLSQGLTLLQEAIQKQGHHHKQLSGEIAFKLYDTYGFPLDLTLDILKEHQMTVDQTAFDACMTAQRELSQAHTTFSAKTWHLASTTEQSQFCGYDTYKLASPILSLANDAGHAVETLTAGQTGSIVLRDTPFYAESGGQVGDKGWIGTDHATFVVHDTQRQGHLIVHHGVLTKGQLHAQATVNAWIDEENRTAIRRNHTATHLLHAALRQILGPTVEQKGSLVEAARARFDFSYAKALSHDQLTQIETLLNTKIRENIEVCTHTMSLDDARTSGAMALFNEKYDAHVRVLQIGDFSKELCGGTHAQHTGDIGFATIVMECGIASGVRRIELLTGEAAVTWVQTQLHKADQAATLLKTNRDGLGAKITQLLQDFKVQEKQVQQLQAKLANQASHTLLSQVETIENIKVLITKIEPTDMQGLRNVMDSLRNQLNEAIIILYTLTDNRMNVVVSVTPSLLTHVAAAPVLAKILCDKAGGRNEMAQGGGEIPSDLGQRIEKLKQYILSTKKG